MTHIETTRVNEVLATHVGVIREFAQKLNVDGDLQTLEADIAELEAALAALKGALDAIPHRHR